MGSVFFVYVCHQSLDVVTPPGRLEEAANAAHIDIPSPLSPPFSKGRGSCPCRRVFAPFLFAYSTISFAQDSNWLLGCTLGTILIAIFSLCTKPTALSAKIKRSKKAARVRADCDRR